MRQLVPIALFVCAPLVAAPAAEACSFVGTFTLSGYPADSAAGVPTDVVLSYATATGATSINPIAKLVLRSDAGPVEGRLFIGSGYFQFAPAQPLAADTRYTLQVVWNASGTTPSETSLRFTTGATPFAGPLPAPAVSISHYKTSSGVFDSCGPAPRNTCFGLAAGSLYLSGFVGDGHVSLSQGSFMSNMYGAEQMHPFNCREFRTLAPNGKLSPATTVCVEDGVMYELGDLWSQGSPNTDLTCTADGLRWKGEPVSKSFKGAPAAPYRQPDGSPGIGRSADASIPALDASIGGPFSLPVAPYMTLSPGDAGTHGADATTRAQIGDPSAASAPPAFANAVDPAQAAEPAGDDAGCSVGRAQSSHSLLTSLCALLALALRSRSTRRGRAQLTRATKESCAG